MSNNPFFYNAARWGIELYDAEKLAKLAASLQSLKIAECNYTLSPRQITRKENLKSEIAKICAKYKLFASFGGDPRGRIVHIYRTAKEARDDNRNSPYLTP